jgi:hypothetical protein
MSDDFLDPDGPAPEDLGDEGAGEGQPIVDDDEPEGPSGPERFGGDR